MVNDLITIIFYIFSKLLDFLFSSYILPGVSLGMIFVVSFIFTIMLKFLISVPQVGGAKRVKTGNGYSSSDDDAS